MEESKVYNLVCKVLLEKYAYSLIVDKDNDGNKHLLMRFRNCYDITPFVLESRKSGSVIKEGILSLVLNEAKSNLQQFSVELYRQNFSMAENYFLVGERLRLLLLSRDVVDIVKVERGRWWVMNATHHYAFLQGQFVYIQDSIGPNKEITVVGSVLKIESIYFLVSNKTSRLVDRIMCPGFYHHELDGSSLEEILIVPAYKMIETLTYDSELKYQKWNDYLNAAYKHSFDSSTAWNIANAVINNHHLLYK